jgi:hypothetical protein
MPETYCHTLIPERIDLAPQPGQVAAFLAALASQGAAPVEGKLRLGKLDGFRTAVNPITQETISFPRRRYAVVEGVTDVTAALQGLDDYSLQFTGKGPPNIPPLTLWLQDQYPRNTEVKLPVEVNDCASVEFKGNYDFIIHCCLRGEVVSTSDQHNSVIDPQLPGFGQPDKSHNRLGNFSHPCTKKVIHIPNAGCTRFWIEFEFGKWLLPKIDDSLDLLEPSIVAAARECFGFNFVQGCHWYG